MKCKFRLETAEAAIPGDVVQKKKSQELKDAKN